MYCVFQIENPKNIWRIFNRKTLRNESIAMINKLCINKLQWRILSSYA